MMPWSMPVRLPTIPAPRPSSLIALDPKPAIEVPIRWRADYFLFISSSSPPVVWETERAEDKYLATEGLSIEIQCFLEKSVFLDLQ